MEFYYNAPEWNPERCPSTCKTAKPRAMVSVKNVTVIVAEAGGASYRSSKFSGIFVVEDESKLPAAMSGKHRIHVFCCWFGHRLHERTPNMLFDMSKCKVIRNYSDMVVSNVEA